MFNELDEIISAPYLDQQKLADWALRMHEVLKDLMPPLRAHVTRSNVNVEVRRMQLAAWATLFHEQMMEKGE